MYGQFDAYVVYGVAEGNRHRVLDPKWLAENFPNFGVYALDVVRMHMGEACYGVKCKVNRHVGMIAPSEEIKKQADELFFKLNKNGRIGYFQVISGDYDKSQHEVYRPN